MHRIGIVGAGAAAAAASYELSGRTDCSITVLEKSGGVCGRAATRRRDGCRYDYGANYLKSNDDRVTELVTETLESDGLFDITEPVWTFDEYGAVEPGRDGDEHKWGYERGLTQLAKRLFGETDATVHRRTRVETIVRNEDDATWLLTDTDGGQWGPFDTLLLNPPAPQTAALLADAQWDSPRRRELEAAVAEVPYRTIWTAVCHYPFRLERPYYALVNTDKAHDVGWVAREECKPGHVPDDESLLVIQANHEWSVDHYDDPPAANVAELSRQVATLLEDERLTDPDWTDHQGWRYALPEDGPATDPLRAAEADGLYCLGDWVAGNARLHAALWNGLEVGSRVLEQDL